MGWLLFRLGQGVSRGPSAEQSSQVGQCELVDDDPAFTQAQASHGDHNQVVDCHGHTFFYRSSVLHMDGIASAESSQLVSGQFDGWQGLSAGSITSVVHRGSTLEG